MVILRVLKQIRHTFDHTTTGKKEINWHQEIYRANLENRSSIEIAKELSSVTENEDLEDLSVEQNTFNIEIDPDFKFQ